jgi:hypothetical protein
MALQPGPRFQQIGDGDGGESPIPGKSGTGTGERPRLTPSALPVPVPAQIGDGDGDGDGGVRALRPPVMGLSRNCQWEVPPNSAGSFLFSASELRGAARIPPDRNLQIRLKFQPRSLFAGLTLSDLRLSHPADRRCQWSCPMARPRSHTACAWPHRTTRHSGRETACVHLQSSCV